MTSRSTRGTSSLLADLQLDVLALGPDIAPTPVDASEHAIALAEEQGFEVIGRGSSRLGIRGDGETVVKVAHSIEGLAMNLHEMAVWQTSPRRARKRLTPCLDLSPELILTQQRVDVIGPPLKTVAPTEKWILERDLAAIIWGHKLYACREALGLWSDPDPDKLRLDNFGMDGRGRIVAIDYGDQFAPLYDEWARLLGVDNAEGLTWRTLAERAGLNKENCPTCPCYCGASFGADSFICFLDSKVADLFTERGLVAPERTAA